MIKKKFLVKKEILFNLKLINLFLKLSNQENELCLKRNFHTKYTYFKAIK